MINEQYWAKIEIFGHRVHYGLVETVEIFGAKFARVSEYFSGEDIPALVAFYAPAAIFALTPLTETEARRWADLDKPYATLALAGPEDADADADADGWTP